MTSAAPEQPPRSLRTRLLDPLARRILANRALNESIQRIQGGDRFRDSLTGLLNRDGFIERAESIPPYLRRSTAIVYIDLDRFKPINDELGHAQGDILLRVVAERLQVEAEVVARLHGDEFAVLMPFTPDVENLDLQEKLFLLHGAIVDSVYTLQVEGQDMDYTIEASMGVCVLSRWLDVTKALHQADKAMYSAKRSKTSYRIYDERVAKESRRSFNTQTGMHLVSNPAELNYAYQPVVNLEDGSVALVEAAIRIPGAETAYFMFEVERRRSINEPLFLGALEVCCREAATWPTNTRNQQVCLSINVSPDLLTRRLAKAIVEVVGRTNFPLDRLQLEVLERGSLTANNEASAAMASLRRHGVRFVLDDFGECDANFASIREFTQHLSGLKIGHYFGGHLLSDPVSHAVVQAIMGLGNELGKTVIVEGIETPAALECLRSMCGSQLPLIQGYLFHHPLTPGPQLHQAISTVSTPLLLS